MLLDVDRVSHRAGNVRLLDRVSWQVAQGQHWAVLGANGAGKTTLLRVASGYLWPNAGGRVRWLDRPTTDLAELRSRIGWVTCELLRRIPAREPALDTVLSGMFGQWGLKRLLFRKPIPPAYVRRAESMLQQIHCGYLADRPFGILSQGEQQLVLIARALITDPVVVFLDEPCAGLDPGARERFLAKLEHLAASATDYSFVLVTHHLEEIVPAFGHTLVLKRGQILEQGKTNEIVTPELINRLYETTVAEVLLRDGRRWPVWGIDPLPR